MSETKFLSFTKSFTILSDGTRTVLYSPAKYYSAGVSRVEQLMH